MEPKIVMSKQKVGPCKNGKNILVETEEVGVHRGPPDEAPSKLRLRSKNESQTKNIGEKEKTQTQPIFVQTPPTPEMPFSDEDEDGPDSFTFYTVPAIVSEMADGKTQSIGIENVMPETKKLAVKGELSDREKQVFRYFRRRMIMDLLQFMMNHLLAAEPDEPIDFLRGLLDQCLLFRSGHLKEPPILYGPEHLESVFNAFDPLTSGYMSTHQYHTAMKTLMVRNYNKHPEKNQNGDVSKRAFLSNADSSEKLLTSGDVPRSFTFADFLSAATVRYPTKEMFTLRECEMGVKVALVENLLDLILLAPSVTEPTPKVMAVDTTPAEKQQKLSTKEGMKHYMKTLLKGKRAAEEAQDSPDEIVELEGIKKPPLLTRSHPKLEKFGEYARPMKHLQEAFKPSPDQHL